MIYPAVLAGVVCSGLALYDLATARLRRERVLRIPIAGCWALAWWLYGFNLASFPAPSAPTVGLLWAACIGSLLIIPDSGNPELQPWRRRGQHLGVFRVYYIALILIAFGVLVMDLWYLVPTGAESGLSMALMIHRTGRRLQSGAYAVPGFEVAHAVAMAGGVIGYALWIAHRDRLGLAGFLVGFACVLSSTGRWDVVTFAVWAFSVHLLLDRASRRAGALAIGYVRLAALLGVFFIAHGELLKKVDSLEHFANLQNEEREDATADLALSGVQMGTLQGSLDAPDPKPPAMWRGTPVECPRWDQGAAAASMALRKMSRLGRLFVVYFAAPMAGLDRALCERRLSARDVVLYWPTKIGRLLRSGAKQLSTVDAYVDVGVPTNNFTVIYSFVCEFGYWGGLAVWAVAVVVLRGFVGQALRGEFGVPGHVAATGVAVAAVPTPLVNVFFDGTLLSWIAVSFGAWLCVRWAAVSEFGARRPLAASVDAAPTTQATLPASGHEE